MTTQQTIENVERWQRAGDDGGQIILWSFTTPGCPKWNQAGVAERLREWCPAIAETLTAETLAEIVAAWNSVTAFHVTIKQQANRYPSEGEDAPLPSLTIDELRDASHGWTGALYEILDTHYGGRAAWLATWEGGNHG